MVVKIVLSLSQRDIPRKCTASQQQALFAASRPFSPPSALITGEEAEGIEGTEGAEEGGGDGVVADKED